MILEPDEEVSGDQHYRKVDCDLSLKIKWFEECCGIRDQKKEAGWEISGEEFIHDASLEYDLHLKSRGVSVRIHVFKGPFLTTTFRKIVKNCQLYISYLNGVLSQLYW